VAGEVWIDAGANAYRLDGTQWHELPGPYGLDGCRVAAESGARTETLSLFDGEQISAVPADTECVAARRTGADEVFCFSREGELFRFDRSSWRRAPQDVFGTTLSADQWGHVPPALWAGNAILAWGTGPDDVFRVSPVDLIAVHGQRHRIEHYDGERWTEIARGDYFDIAGSAADDVWMVGKPLMHWDGSALHEVSVPDELYPSAAVSFGPKAAWFIATQYTPEPKSSVLRYDGSWSVQYTEPSSDAFEDIAGRSADDLWLLAIRQPMLRQRGTGALIRYDGKTWRAADLWQTWGFGALILGRDDLWVSDTDSIYRVPLSNLSAADSFVPMVAGTKGQLWLGPSDVWLTTAHQAMRLSL
jgi:hypothetical protein